MITVEAAVTIRKRPKEICRFILNLDKADYLRWHPNHEDFEAVKRTPEIVNSVLYFKEHIAGIDLHYEWVVDEYIEDRKFLLRAKYFIPITLLLEFMPKGDHSTRVMQRITIGSDSAVQKVVDPLIKMAYLSEEQREEIRIHFIEEFENLESII